MAGKGHTSTVRMHVGLAPPREYAVRWAEGKTTGPRLALAGNRPTGTAHGILVQSGELTA